MAIGADDGRRTWQLGKALSGFKYTEIAARAAIGNTVHQAVGNLTGSQQGFSWTSVAVSSLAAAGGAAFSDKMGWSGENISTFAEKHPVLADSLSIGSGAIISAATRLTIQGGKLDWVTVAADTLSGFVGARLQANPISNRSSGFVFDGKSQKTGIQLRPEDLPTDFRNSVASSDLDDAEYLRVIDDMNAGHSISDEDRYFAAGHRMRLAGATEAEITSVRKEMLDRGLFPAMYDPDSALDTGMNFGIFSKAQQLATFRETDITGDVLKLQPVDVNFSAFRHSPVLGSDALDIGSMRLGKFGMDISQRIEQQPSLGYALLAIDFVAGPVAFGARALLAETPLGDAVANVQEAVFAKATGAFEQAGYDPSEAVEGASGIFLALGITTLGAPKALNGLGQVVDKLKNLRNNGANSAGGVTASTATTARITGQLVQDIAERADVWGARQGLGNGPVAGTLKHGYADALLTRYQRMYGDLGLTTEVRYTNGRLWQSGDPLKGSVRLDVVEGPLSNPTAIYDYKFGGAQLSPSRITQIRSIAGGNSNVPIFPVRP
ncbi:hypothetical protein ED236_09310 [Pseudomethylobacillus aquaticus]|uniref:Uncharacterized protein n=1 Tax=Pseudomethylobacillus aquaticus TaxID=2676064 RepID=A0A3N0UZC5_9PROT|nr:hypothetical protein [Pseudomethylobacillus aquaticus]ROH85916.1 hypothetical protein ED236_09310 [Pseudomethylobacillus aquaticus]